jgi:protein RecA
MAKTTEKKKSLAEKLDGVGDKKIPAVKKADLQGNNFDKIKVLTQSLNKHYGSDFIKTGDNIPKIYKVRSGEPALDFITDGGAPVSRVFEALGQEHTGKTRNGLIWMGKWQKYCFNCHKDEALTTEWQIVNDFPTPVSCSCAYCDKPKTCVQVMVDIEGTTDPKFMHLFGIDVNGILYFRPDLFSKAVDIVDAFLRVPGIGFIMVDSVASIGANDKEVVNKMEDNKMNQNALAMNQTMRKWQAGLNTNTNNDPESPTTIYIVNQSYSSIGIFVQEIAQGGRGLRHGKGISIKTRIEEKAKEGEKDDKKIVGVHIVAENMKNKTGIPYRKISYYIDLKPGEAYCQTDKHLQILDLAIMFDIVHEKGSWYSYEGTNIGQGKTQVLTMLQDNLAFFEEIKDKVYEKI